MGKEASGELAHEVRIVRDGQVEAYLGRILRKLEQSKYARTLGRDGSREALFPFNIRVIYDKRINAFSLPGGPLFVNTGAIEAADNEAQLAGVIAHEMSHVVLRHMTNQATKREFVALPAVLASTLAGNSLLGELTKIGIGFTANSALLKFSRSDEAEADYNGAEIMADAGYNPIEMARFFEKLEEQAGRGDAIEEFLSDHPNPGNRIAAISDEVRELPRRAYVDDETGQFLHVREVVRHLAAPSNSAPQIEAPPNGRLVTFDGATFTVRYPENGRVYRREKRDAVTIGPEGGVLDDAVGYGMEADYYAGDADGLIQHLEQTNADMRVVREARNIQVGGKPALLNTLNSKSPLGGEEVDVVVTVARPEGLFYMVFIAPKAEFERAQTVFEDMLRSVRFR